MMKAVIFDAFGTLVEIRNRQHPYRQLLRLGSQQGRVAAREDMRWIMTNDCEVAEAADHFGIRLTPAQLSSVQDALDRELESLNLFQDAEPAIEQLRSHGVKVGICSNLAAPYCKSVRLLIPGLDAYCFSSEVGLMKPDAGIYLSICHMLGFASDQFLGASPERVVMIGDSRKCDQNGPRQIGIKGFHLDRAGAGRFGNLLRFAHVMTDTAGLDQ
ncbi:HAD family hydrolase [Pseudomonas thivervalensis]|uniref:HAD family hydrolase n=1 Tax=Pseudomonas thivervalensis TaxID=86265 RepID=UPI003D999C98